MTEPAAQFPGTAYRLDGSSPRTPCISQETWTKIKSVALGALTILVAAMLFLFNPLVLVTSFISGIISGRRLDDMKTRVKRVWEKYTALIVVWTALATIVAFPIMVTVLSMGFGFYQGAKLANEEAARAP